MPRFHRNPPAGYVYHVLNRANRRSTLFTHADDYDAFIQVVRESLLLHPVRILHYCVMPNHWHFVLWPTADDQLARFMHHLTTTHATRWNRFRELTGSGHVYQGPYKFFPIQEDDHYYHVGRYVVRNARRANLVARVEDWPWSSVLNLGAIPLCEGPLPIGGDWLQWVNQPQSLAELAALRHAVLRGCPYGDETWRQDTARALGIEHTLRASCRPRR